MDDMDGDPAVKKDPDFAFNSDQAYVRYGLDSNAAENWTFIDFATSWARLDSATDPTKTWALPSDGVIEPTTSLRVQFASISGANDHAAINFDVAGGGGLEGMLWSAPFNGTTVPEPRQIIVLSAFLGCLGVTELWRRRRPRGS
jgi:hypothetical protein